MGNEMKSSALVVPALVAISYAANPLTEGNPQSPVRVIIYEDLQCSDCATFAVMMEKQILPKYASRVAFEHHNFPLPKHAWARKAAVASRFFEGISAELALAFRRYAMSHQAEIEPGNFNEKLSAFAKSKGFDIEKVMAGLKDPAINAQIENEYKDAVARGIGKTPTVLVDGEPFVESFTFKDIAAALDKAIAAAAPAKP